MRQSKKRPRGSNPLQKKSIQVEGIKNLDIMGGKFKFQHTKTSKRYQTRLGGCVTLLISGASLIALILVSSKYFDTRSPVITTNRELSTRAQSINLYQKDVLAGFSVAARNVYEPLKMNNFMTVIGQIVTKTFDPATNSTKIDLTKKFNYIPCPLITEDPSIIELVQKMTENADLRLILCPHFKEVDNDVTLSYDPENLSSSFLSVKIYPCSLSDAQECFPVQKVFGAEVTFGDINSLISPSNYTDPVAFRWIPLIQSIDTSISKSFRYELEQNKILDDRNFLKKPQLKADYAIFKLFTTDAWARDMTQLYCTSAMIDAGQCQEYMEFVYEMSNEVVITTRRYKKIPALMGEFGGILKLLTTVFVILSFYYSVSIHSFLFNKAFGLKESKTKNIFTKVEKGLDENQNKNNQKDQLKKVHFSSVDQTDQPDSTFTQKTKDSRLDSCLKETIESKVDIVELAKKVNFIDVLSGSCIKRHHQILLPLLLLKSKQSALNLDPNPSI